MPKFQKGDRVRARNCSGVARVEVISRKYGVVILDRPLLREFVGEFDRVTVPFFSFPASHLRKVPAESVA